ncbi:MAG: glycoside hydrolase family 11 protein [Oscillospiraceae bacterium]|nr:glycoside hydrolase family 11 protein [Oscillospiraceae bacterium]
MLLRKKSKAKFTGLSVILIIIFTFLSVTVTVIAANSSSPEYPVITRNKKDKYEGFDFELWTQNKNEDVRMTLMGGGNFSCEWNNAFNVLFRTGKKLSRTMTYEEYGNITIDYTAKHNITKGDASYLCIYGWTEDPLIEFYVVENYFSYKPPGGKGYQGTFEADGGTYEVYVGNRVDMPSIHRDKDTFLQYFSVRVDRRTEGTISLDEHFKAWGEMGLDVSGTMYEISFCAEGFNTSGSAEISEYILTIGDDVYGVASEKTNISSESAENVNLDDFDEQPENNIDEPAETPEETEEIETAETVNTSVNSDTEPEEENSGIAVYILIGIVGIGAIVIVIIIGVVKKRVK